MAIRVLLVDDQILTRLGLRVILQREKDIEIVGEAETGRDALEKSVALSPEVILMDLRMPDGDGIEATREIKQRCRQTQILILSVYADLELFREAVAAGAVGYMLKDITPANLVTAIRAAQTGKTMINPTVVRQVVEALCGSKTNAGINGARGHHGLTQREIEVLTGIAQGLSDKEIASKLFLSASTVKAHLRGIYHRLKLRNRAQAAAFVVESNLLNRFM